MKRAFSGGGDDCFHRLRIRLKNLGYELQFLMPVWSKRLRSMVAQLKKVEELIGNDHDLTVLKAALQGTPEDFGGRPVVKRVLRQLKKRSQKLRRACRPLAKKVLNERPHRFLRKLHRHWTQWRKSAGSRQAMA